MRKLFIVLIFIAPLFANAADERILRQFGVSTTINFSLWETDDTDLKSDASFEAGDCKVMLNEGAEGNCANLPTDEGQGYSLVLSATEMSYARTVVYLVDTAAKAWKDKVIVVETFGSSLTDGTATAGAASSITLGSDASASNDFYNSAWVSILSGTGAGQYRLITDYVGSTKVATVAPAWVTNPSSDSVYAIIPSTQSDVGAISGEVTTNVAELTTLPDTTPNLMGMFQFLYHVGRNKIASTATTQTLYQDDSSTALGTSTLSDDGTTFTKTRMTDAP